LPEEWKESIIVPIYNKDDKTDFSNYTGVSLLLTTYTMFSNILLSLFNSICREGLLRTIRVDFNSTGQLQTIYSAAVTYSTKDRNKNDAVHQPFMDFKKAY
jgi:hypothetical protein